MARDRIHPLKIEGADTGGTQEDEFPTAANPNEDYGDFRGITLQSDTSDDEAVGAERDSSDRQVLWDAENPAGLTLSQLAAGGGGLTPTTHRALDQLVHDVAESYYLENTWSGAKLTNMIYWVDASKTTKVREHQYTYTGNRVATETIIQYDAAGAEVERLTIANTWTGGRLTSQTAVLT